MKLIAKPGKYSRIAKPTTVMNVMATRETTDPQWTHSIAGGKVTSYTVKDMSNDNDFFGVRAVDRAGHKSPMSFPKPQR